MSEKIVLAYSGGLDTSVILKWLVEQGNEVIAYVADVGQKEDFKEVEKKALLLGAKKVYVEDLKEGFVKEYIFSAMKSNAVYEGTYLLGTALARPLIAKKQVEIAKKENATALGHGATGKGNDQVRFELTYLALMPEAKIVSPWKNQEFLEKFKGRSDLINYAKEKGIPVPVTIEKPYSMDENLMHISYESGVLEDPAKEPDEEMFKITKSPQEADGETKLKIKFEKGLPVEVEDLSTGKKVNEALEIFNHLNKLGAKNGIGRIDLVENRFVGIKSRGVYETPAGTILWKAHRDIEGLCLDKEVCHLKDTMMPKIAELIYNGFWFSPEMEFLMAAIEKSQEKVSGTVFITLYKGNVIVTGRESEESLYNADFSSMDKEGGFNQLDSEGFIKINSIRLQAWQWRKKNEE
jgi:argininosuccinate synthase